jgi:electron transfer flavoprotein beta subunit
VNVVVCAKLVPTGTPTLGPDHLVQRSGAEGMLDPGDEYGLELALQLTEQHGGDVTVVSMGPEEAGQALQRALAMGAGRGMLVSDPALRGADALVTARVLAAAMARYPFDLVVAGVESTDGYTGTVPVTVAEILGIASVTAVRRLEPSDAGVRIERMTERGYDVYECPLPAVVTVTAGSVEPRYPSLKGIMQAKQKPVDRPSLQDLGLSDLAATQTVTAVTDAPATSGGEVVQGDEAVGRIADLLAEAKVI